MQIRILHFCRRVHQACALEIAADLNNPGALESEVRLALSGSQIDGESPVGAGQHFLGFSGQMARCVEEFKPHLPLTADSFGGCRAGSDVIAQNPAHRQQADKKCADGKSLHKRIRLLPKTLLNHYWNDSPTQLRRRPGAPPSTTSTRLSLSREMPTTIRSSVSPESFSNECTS